MKNKTEQVNLPKIKIIGFGGCGSNTLADLSGLVYPGLELIAANTDFLNLARCGIQPSIPLGKNICRGLGTGGDVTLGRLAAENSYQDLIARIKDTSLLILTAGMGGGTGSGAIEIAARIARSLNVPTISFVSLPFSFESDLRKTTAYESTIALQQFTDTLITLPNDKLLSQENSGIPLTKALRLANKPLQKFIAGLFDLIDHTGVMHIDLSYVNDALLAQQGILITTGSSNSSDRISSALDDALDIPFIDAAHFETTSHVVMKLTGNITVEETHTAIAQTQKRFPSQPRVTPIIASNDASQQLSISLLVSGIGATAVSYPSSWVETRVEKSTALPHTSSHSSKEPDQQPYDFHDILEVPAYIRNENNRRKVLNN